MNFSTPKQLRANAKLPADTIRHAAPLEGEFWFPSRPDVARPTPGAISLVWLVMNNDCDGCLARITMVRRLQQQFPELELTIAARTHGYVGMVREPPKPAHEAALVDSLYRIKYALPATVVVAQTPYWRLPDPDRRVIEELVPNEEHYRRQSISPFDRDVFYLIDRDGNIIYSGGDEEELRDLLYALTQQAGH